MFTINIIKLSRYLKYVVRGGEGVKQTETELIKNNTCSNPPNNSVVSIALFMGNMCNSLPVNSANNFTTDVFPHEAGPI